MAREESGIHERGPGDDRGCGWAQDFQRRWTFEGRGLDIKPALPVRKLRDLDLAADAETDRPPFCSSASGLVASGGELYVVADDELHLCRFGFANSRPGERIRLFDGELPERKKKRKMLKPDLEILLRLPAFGECRHGALLALGSGSGKHRTRGAILALNVEGRVDAAPMIFGAEEFFSGLAERFAELNLEGGWIGDRTLHLLQRGNKGSSPNAIIGLDLDEFLRALASASGLPAMRPTSIRESSLGSLAGVPLCFSDACALDDGQWIFTAVAEDTDSSYADGACVGAAVGLGDAQGRVQWLRPIEPRYKIEGVETMPAVSRNGLLLVTDADDPDLPACLLSAVI